MGRAPSHWLPALTMIELLAALFILGLMASIAFAQIGPSVAGARQASIESLFWRDVAQARLTMHETMAAAVQDEGALLTTTQRSVRFTLYAPRFSGAPTEARFDIVPGEAGDTLMLTIGGIHSNVLQAPGAMRFRQIRTAGRGAGMVVEAELGGSWRPVLAAQTMTNGPMACTFDPISRVCR